LVGAGFWADPTTFSDEGVMESGFLQMIQLAEVVALVRLDTEG